MLQREEVLLIIYFILIIFILIVFGLVFFMVFQRRKNKLIHEKLMVELNYKSEIEKSKFEIQEQTLKNVAWELHDNIGQLLSVVNLQLNIMSKNDCNHIQSHLKEVKSVVQITVQEIRSLSKTLNNEVVQMMGVIRSIELELERINRLKYAHTSFVIKGNPIPINNQDEIIIFRIIQEFLSNTIKHAKAKNINLMLEFTENFLYLSILDDGQGFDVLKESESSGLQNMKSRARLLNADFNLYSEIQKGTQIKLTYNLKNNEKR